MTNRDSTRFPPVSKQQWINQAIKDLNGEDFDRTLITRTLEGFPIFPFYTEEDIEAIGVKNYENQFHPPSEIPGISPRIWTNAVEVGGADESAFNKEIKLVLSNGADGLILELSGKEDLDQLFEDVVPQYIQIWVRPQGEPRAVLQTFFDWVDRNSIHHFHINGGFLWDGLVRGFDRPVDLANQIEDIFFLHKISKSYPNFKSICLDTSIYHDAGATAVQELGYGMAALIELLDGLTERGADAVAIFKDLFIKSAVGSNYFMEIAKLKTFRTAMHQIAGLYKVDLQYSNVHLFAISSQWSQSVMGSYNNILRNTTEAMSAILGGCNTLFIRPHNSFSQNPDAFSKRMARNISSILKEECYFDKVIDPAAASYYVESLMASLYEHAIQLLKKTEDEGGWYQLYLQHNIQEDIKKVRKEKFDRLIRKETVMVGVNQYVDPMSHESRQMADIQEEAYQLKPFCQSYPIEKQL
jgi:methylmalonyl-CoA mutase